MRRVAPGSQAEQVGRLFLAAVLVVFAPHLPFGNFLIYPFMILGTWFHEMGHGLTALALGHEFDRLLIFADGSGIAESVTPADLSPLSSAAIAAGGPIAPSLAGALLILASGRRRIWRPALLLLAGTILLSVLIWVRTPTGGIVLPLIAVGLAWMAWKGRDTLVRFMLQFLGMLAGLSMFLSWDYLFMESAVVGGQVILSDTGAIAASLQLPHWLWALLLTGFAAIMIGGSLKLALAWGDGALRSLN